MQEAAPGGINALFLRMRWKSLLAMAVALVLIISGPLRAEEIDPY